MEKDEINKFLISLGLSYSEEGLKHYIMQCQLIANKLMNPSIMESNFITLVSEENWSKAFYFADTRNKEAFGISLYQNFVKYVKSTPAYITKRRNDKLNDLDLF